MVYKKKYNDIENKVNLEQTFKSAGEMQKAQNVQHSSFKDITLRASIDKRKREFLFLDMNILQHNYSEAHDEVFKTYVSKNFLPVFTLSTHGYTVDFARIRKSLDFSILHYGTISTTALQPVTAKQTADNASYMRCSLIWGCTWSMERAERHIDRDVNR